ncbi:MAG: hypothetical protein JO100_03635, partial [Pseudonocardia sp.]|nr:hypothetical protein [Pseudonocardia sp.]
MTTRMLRDEVAQRMTTLRLTALQAARLAEIVKIMADDGRFLLRDALDVGEFPAGDARGQEAFQDFRKRVNQAAIDAHVELRLELDSRKTTPDQRYCWFTGGDLIDAGIALLSSETAGRTGTDHAVAPEVAELGTSRRTRVYVSVPRATGPTARKLDGLVRQLRERLALDGERSWEVTDSNSVGLGEDLEAGRERLHTQADVRLVLVSPAHLADDECKRLLNSPNRVVAFAVNPLPDGPLKYLGGLRIHDIRRRHQPWEGLTSANQRSQYVADVVDEIKRSLRPPALPPNDSSDDDLFKAWLERQARHRRTGESKVLIETESAETSLQESRLDGSISASGPSLPAVGRLVDWVTATDEKAPRLCALLGDVGMGKTTTAKLFTQRLLDLRTSGKAVPLPILFDLRDVRITGLAERMTVDHILDSMLDANRPAGIPRS